MDGYISNCIKRYKVHKLDVLGHEISSDFESLSK